MKRIIAQLYFLLLSLTAFAQFPPPCPSDQTPPSDICNQTCIYCDFTVIQSSTAGYTGQTPSGFCGSIENEQWLGFVAVENGLTVTALPSNCTNGDGLQIAVYEGCSGSPLGCYGGIGGGATTPATVSVANLVIGQTYYILVDGFAGDQCDFTLVADPLSGVTAPTPELPDTLIGNMEVCNNSIKEYSVPPIIGASAYTWSAPPGARINGMPSPATIMGNATGNTVTITFGTDAGDICVLGLNACNEGPELCLPVSILNDSQPVHILPDTLICFENLPYVTAWGDTVQQAGTYSITLPNPPCDSFVQQEVFVSSSVPTSVPPFRICDSSSITICGTVLDSLGTFIVPCTANTGCDSLLEIRIVNSAYPPLQIPDTSICAENVPYVTPWGDSVFSTDVYVGNLSSQYGCDSTVRQFVFVKFDVPTMLPPATLCLGDTLWICDSLFLISGSDPTDFSCIGADGCDSNFIVTILTPSLIATINLPQEISSQNPVVTLSYAPSPANPTWYFDGMIVGTGLTLDVSQPGMYVLELEYMIGSGNCSAFDTVFVNSSVSNTELSASNSIRIQPTIGSANFYISSEKSPMRHIRLVDMRGRLIFEEKIGQVQAYTLDASSFPAATYQVMVLIDGHWVIERIVKL